MKITEKVAFNIANEASNVYILNGQKFIKIAKNWSLLAWSLRSNSVTRQVTYNRPKIGGKCQNSNIQKCNILSDFQTLCKWLITLNFRAKILILQSIYRPKYWFFFLTKKSILNPSFGTNIQSRDILLFFADFHTSTVVHFADNSIFSQLLKWGRSGGKFGT